MNEMVVWGATAAGVCAAAAAAREGLAAVAAPRAGRAVQSIDVATLQDRLREQGAVLTL